MKRKWWLVPVALALFGVLWILASDKALLEPLQTAIGFRPASAERAKSKPICNSPVNPNVAAPTDCIPQHMANLPPDPGPAGELTIDGIDLDKDGLRDDVQRKMAERWGDSPLAMKVLTRIALSAQLAVHHGGDLSKEEAMKLGHVLDNAGYCYAQAAPQAVKDDGGLEKTQAFVMNTYERTKRLRDFNFNFANNMYPMSDAPTAELCGFDPASLPN